MTGSNVLQADQLFTMLNKMPELKITKIENGTNISVMKLAVSVNSKKLTDVLWEKYRIALPVAKSDGMIKLTVNDSLLTRTNEQIAAAFKDAISSSRA
jgi:threonine aldolase